MKAPSLYNAKTLSSPISSRINSIIFDKIGIGILRPKIDFIFSDSSTKDRPLYSSILFSIAYSRNAFLTIGTYSSIIGAFDKDVSFK